MSAFSSSSFSTNGFSVNAFDFGGAGTVDRTTGGGPPKVQWGYWLKSKYYDFSDPEKTQKTGEEQRAELAAIIRADSIARGIIVEEPQIQAQAAIEDAANLEQVKRAAPEAAKRAVEARAQSARDAYMAAYRQAYRDTYTQETERQLQALFSLELRERRIKRNRDMTMLMLVAMS